MVQLSHARAHSGCEVSCQGVPSQLALSLRLCFIEASQIVKKAISCYNADRLVASLPGFCSIQSSLAVHEFHAAGKECCEQGHRRVCANLWCLHDVVVPKVLIAAMWAQRTYLWILYVVATRRTLKTTKLSKLGGRLSGYGHLPGTIRYVYMNSCKNI